MKIFAKLAAVLLLLTALVGLCAAAEAAEEETVQLTVYAVDTTTGLPLYTDENNNTTFTHYFLRHLQCQNPGWHDPVPYVPCNCYSSHFKGQEPCSYCGGVLLPEAHALQYGDTGRSATFSLYPGHEYMLFVNTSENYLNQLPITVGTDAATGKIYLKTEHEHIRWLSENELEIGYEIAFTPTTVSLNATKLMDGKDPGDLKFAFKVWHLPEDMFLNGLDSSCFVELLGEENIPEWKDEYDDMDPVDVFHDAFPPELVKLMVDRFCALLEDIPYSIVYSDGSVVPFLRKTYSIYDMWDHRRMEEKFVIAEVNESGNGICEDAAVYIVSYTALAQYPTLPTSLDNEQVNPPVVWEGFNTYYDKMPIQIFNGYLTGLSPTSGFIDAFIDFEEELVSDYFIFRNTTCPYADPGPTETPEPVPDVPATADGGFPIYWAALFLVGVMVMILRPRKA